MTRLIPFFSLIFNFTFLYFLENVAKIFIPSKYLLADDITRTLVIYVAILIFLYTSKGQRMVAFFAKGRNTIAREEKILEPIIEDLKKTDIGGYSGAVRIFLVVLETINIFTLKLTPLDTKIKKLKYEYKTGTVKIFTFDSLDIETNSFGNSIFISKGAIDTLTKDELKSVVYNEFAQVKYNISSKRLLHQSGIMIGRISCVLIVLLFIPVLLVSLNGVLITLNSLVGANGQAVNSGATNFPNVIMFTIFAVIRLFIFLTMWKNKIGITNLPYSFYERKIFVRADMATYKIGLADGMLSYLEKLYVFKLSKKNYGRLFSELRPIVAYRINFFDYTLKNGTDSLLVDNYAWSSNYLERVELIANKKD